METKLVNCYILLYAPSELKWYEKGGLLTYIDHLKYKDFIEDTDGHFLKAKIINFDIIHKQCQGEHTADDLLKKYSTIVSVGFVKYDNKTKVKALSSALRCKRKEGIVCRGLVF